VEQVADAAAMGDRSENAEYIYGKKRLRQIDSRLHFLERRLADVVVVDPSEQSVTDIRFGATVVLEDEDTEQEVVYVLVGEDEIDPSQNRISWQSPVGRALIGKNVDDLVVVETPKGRRELIVLRFSYETT
jgi:transcription elongation factor GreB